MKNPSDTADTNLYYWRSSFKSLTLSFVLIKLGNVFQMSSLVASLKKKTKKNGK